jgi:hypothetical protein
MLTFTLDSVYKHLTLGIEFMLDKMFGNVPDTYQSECRHLFRQIFYRPLCTAIINDYLRKTIPTRREDLDTFTGILEQSRAFDALFISISEYTMIHKLFYSNDVLFRQYYF